MNARHRYRRRPSRRVVLGCCLFAVIAARAAYGWLSQPAPVDPSVLQTGAAMVTVIDGQATIFVRQRNDEGREHEFPLRLLGVTLDSAKLEDAVDLLRRRLSSREIRLELDQRRIDRSGRCFAYVYDQGVLINELLVYEGLATAEDYPGDALSVASLLRAADQDARDNCRGMWGDGCRDTSTVPAGDDAR
jgi:endonuclease YncB( thermonuclease family)